MLVVGLALLAGGGAPAGWLAVQAGAGVIALALFLPPARQKFPRHATALLLVTPFVMLATLLFDNGLDGVHRWLSVGPIKLHIGLLLLPILVALHARGDGRYSSLSLIACAAVIGLQPDLGMALGLTLALFTITLIRRDRQDWLTLAASTAALVLCLVSPDPLQPVAMVEHVLIDSWQWAVWTGPLALIGALVLPVTLLWRACTGPALRLPAVSLAGLWLGLLLASLIGHFPVPLLGYGASAVIGWGLALAWMEAPGNAATPRG